MNYEPYALRFNQAFRNDCQPESENGDNEPQSYPFFMINPIRL